MKSSQYCVVVYCQSTKMLHKFPNPLTQKRRFLKWVCATGCKYIAKLDPTIVQNEYRICSRHFDKKCYAATNRLMRNACPTLHLPDPVSVTDMWQDFDKSDQVGRIDLDDEVTVNSTVQYESDEIFVNIADVSYLQQNMDRVCNTSKNVKKMLKVTHTATDIYRNGNTQLDIGQEQVSTLNASDDILQPDSLSNFSDKDHLKKLATRRLHKKQLQQIYSLAEEISSRKTHFRESNNQHNLSANITTTFSVLKSTKPNSSSVAQGQTIQKPVEMCRICFKGNQLEDIYSTYYKNCSIIQLIETCVPVTISKDTQYSQLCLECRIDLIQTFYFIKKVIQAEQLIHLGREYKPRRPEVEDPEMHEKGKKSTFFDDEITEIEGDIDVAEEASADEYVCQAESVNDSNDFAQPMINPSASSVTHGNGNCEVNNAETESNRSIQTESEFMNSAVVKMKKESEVMNSAVVKKESNSLSPIIATEVDEATQKEDNNLKVLHSSEESKAVSGKQIIKQYFLIKKKKNMANWKSEGNVIRIPEEEAKKILESSKILQKSDSTNRSLHSVGPDAVHGDEEIQTKHKKQAKPVSIETIKILVENNSQNIKEESTVCSSKDLDIENKLKVNFKSNPTKNKRARRKPYLCDRCGMCFQKISQLRLHVNDVHVGVSRMRNRKRAPYRRRRNKYDERRLCCEICGELFASQEFKMHVQTHSILKQFKGVVCGKGFKKGNLLDHNTSEHVSEGKYKPCGIAFSREAQLPLHDKTCHQSKASVEHQCKKCGYACTTRRLLELHLRKRHRLFSCKVCERVFQTYGDWWNHKVVHAREFVCRYCNRICLNSGRLSLHEAAHVRNKNQNVNDTNNSVT